jgi:hypothetical protein
MSPRKTRPQRQPEQGTTKKASFADLTQPEQDVMLQLAQSRETNVVFLAAAMWRITPDWQAYDPYPLLTYTLDSLAARGLCTFRLTKGVNEGGWTSLDMPKDIRLTPIGWTLMGYPNVVVEVGSMQRHRGAVPHGGDMTNYRNQPFHARPVGPIEKEDFATHRDHYPSHVHMYGVPLTMANQATQDKRTYNRVTADIEARVINAREVMGLASYTDIAEYAGLPERTVKYVLVDLPRLRRINSGEAKAQGSLKERVMVAVKELGSIKDVSELRRIVGMADNEHDVMHVLHSLHTQGRIDFDERGNGMGTATVINIRLPKKGAKRLTQEVADALPEIVRDRLPEAVEPEATTPEPPVPAPSAPEPESEGYPLLDLLLQRERARLEGDSKGMAFVVAAEAIQDIDPTTARELMAKAKQYDVPFPTPIEQEYIRYVAAHPKVADGTVE